MQVNLPADTLHSMLNYYALLFLKTLMECRCLIRILDKDIFRSNSSFNHTSQQQEPPVYSLQVVLVSESLWYTELILHASGEEISRSTQLQFGFSASGPWILNTSNGFHFVPVL